MAAAYRAGYTLGEIAAHFAVPATTVRRAIDEQGAALAPRRG
jgi:hypothetical protein